MCDAVRHQGVIVYGLWYKMFADGGYLFTRLGSLPILRVSSQRFKNRTTIDQVFSKAR